MAEPGAMFISYRRSDAGGYAWALRDYLTLRFDPDTLFFDRETIDAGSAFPDRLRQGVENCLVLLAVIGPNWLEAADDNGGRRLDDQDDWVRREIAMALALGKTVIPVLFGDNTQPPPADRLPEPLQPLASLQVKRLRGDRREYEAQRDDLVRILARVPGVPQPRPDQTQPVVGIPSEQLPAIIAAATGDWKQLTDEQRQTIEELKSRIDVGEGALRAFFRALGEAEVKPEKQEARLMEIARQFKDLQQQFAAAPEDAPDIARLKQEAHAALDVGDLETADALLTEVLAAEDTAIDQRRLQSAATAGQRGEIALIRLRYVEAAKHFAAAANRVPPGYEDDRLRYLDNEVAALDRQGEEKGDKEALREAIDRYNVLLLRCPRERKPLAWAMTQNNLGKSLLTLGLMERSLDNFFAAQQAFRAALEAVEDVAQPHYGSLRRTIQSNLAGVTHELGTLKSGTVLLMQARQECEKLLAITSRFAHPLSWAKAQYNLGNILLSIAEREGTSRLLRASVKSFRRAIKRISRDLQPLFWASVQNSLGSTLLELGEREGSTELLTEAVWKFRAALEERTRERVPLAWAETQNNLGNCLTALGECKGDPDDLRAAIEAFENALKERKHERIPRKWSETLNNLSFALYCLGHIEDEERLIHRAIEVVRQALQERSRDRLPLHFARSNVMLSQLLTRLGAKYRCADRFREAEEACEAALIELTREREPLGWAMAQFSLGIMRLERSKISSGRACLTDAEGAEIAFRKALDVMQTAGPKRYCADVTRGLAEALFIVGAQTTNIPKLNEAKKYRVTASQVLDRAHVRSSPKELQHFLWKVDVAITTIRKRPWSA